MEDGWRLGPGSANAPPELEVSGLTVARILGHVKALKGELGVEELLAEAGQNRAPEFLWDTANWYTVEAATNLMRAAGRLLDDPNIFSSIGEGRVLAMDRTRNPRDTAMAEAVMKLGSPDNYFNLMPSLAKRYTRTAFSEVPERGDGFAVRRMFWGSAGYERGWCRYTVGLSVNILSILGYGAEAKERNCAFDGAPYCDYEIRWWKGDADHQHKLLQDQLRVVTRRFETLQEVVTDIVSTEDAESVLANVFDKAKETIRADGHLLVVHMEEGQPLTVLRHNIADAALDALVAEVMAPEVDEHGGARLIVDVASARRSYGRLAAIFPDGAGMFMDEERRLLVAYARHAAGALDVATALEQVRYLAFHDPLTGLSNRRLFEDRVGQTLSLAMRMGTEGAVMFIDLDHFKKINDSLGHEAGDELLLQVSQRLTHTLRGSDTVGRRGGDEFTVLLANVTEAGHAGLVAEKILDSFLDPFDLDDQKVYVTASIGVATFPKDGTALDDVLKNADAAMYAAKESGRNCYRVYSEAMNESAAQDLVLETELNEALRQGELTVAYQPVVDLASGVIVAMEGLVRWNHPTRGMLEPADFLPLAEATGLVKGVDDLVLETVCGQGALWAASLDSPVRVSVNIGVTHFIDPDLVAQVARCVTHSGLDPALLELEITEALTVDEPQAVIATLEKLQGMGVGVAIDDFGTAYSMLSQVQQLPVDRIKINKSLISRILTADDHVPVVSALVAMAHAMGTQVVAKGVETQAQHQFLLTHHCDLGQGFLYGPPLPAPQAQHLLTTGLAPVAAPS